MSIVLNYVVHSASLVDQTRTVDVDGEPTEVSVKRGVVEAVPVSGEGATFTMSVSATALAEFPEGTVINVTVEADAAATKTKGA